MNKKIIVMLTAVISVLSVILVSLFGQIPNFDMNILVSEIVVEGYLDKNGEVIPCEKNNAGENVIWIEEIDPGETTIILKWKVVPDEASNPDVYFSTNHDDGSVVVSSQGIITFYDAEKTNVVISIMAEDGGLAEAKVIIMKRYEDDGGSTEF